MPDGQRASRSARAFSTLALIAAALTLVVVIASAYMRHAQSGLACNDWPACYARTGVSETTPGIALARGVHRAAATAVSLAVIVLVALSWRSLRSRPARLAVTGMTIVVALATLGVATPGARLPAIAWGNLLGGLALLAVLAAAHTAAGPAPPADPRSPRMLAIATLVLAFLQAALGGLIATQSGLLACPSFPACDDASWHTLISGDAWNPFRTTVESNGGIVAPAGASALHVAHRAGGLLVAALVLLIGARLWKPRGGLAAGLVLVLCTVAGAGIAAALVPQALGVTLVHDAASAVLIALLARAALVPATDSG